MQPGAINHGGIAVQQAEDGKTEPTAVDMPEDQEEDSLFKELEHLAQLRQGRSDPCALPQVIRMHGGQASLNQVYHIVDAVAVNQVLHRKGFVPSKAQHHGHKIYICSKSFCGKPGALPYLWQDLRYSQWKVAVLGRQNSLYRCDFPQAGRFPNDLGTWQSLSEPDPPPALVIETVSCGESRLRALLPEQTPGRDRSRSPRGCLMSPQLLSDYVLSGEDATDFHKNGYIVKRAKDLNTQASARLALRACNLILQLASAAGDADLNNYSVQDDEQAWPDLSSPLRLPAVWSCLTALLGDPLRFPKRVQVAINMPEGGFGENFEGRIDTETNYHIDGRGSIPNNFELLVGVALSEPPEGAKSWGGLMVFPGSHADVELHKAYVKFMATEGSSRPSLEKGCQLELYPGDVVIAHSLLAHRRAQNWSAVPRYMLYFRLSSVSGALRTLDGDPFVPFPGLKKVLRSTQ